MHLHLSSCFCVYIHTPFFCYSHFLYSNTICCIMCNYNALWACCYLLVNAFSLQKKRSFTFTAIYFDGRLGCPFFNLECFSWISEHKISWSAFYMYSLQFTATWRALCCQLTICMYHSITYSTYQSMRIGHVILLDK